MNPTVLLFVTVLAVVCAFTDDSPASGNFRCDLHDPSASQQHGAGCLANLNIRPELYERCRGDDTTETCFIFLQEPPFIILNDIASFNSSEHAFALQEPFRCGEFEQQFSRVGGISGISLTVHKETSSRDDWCMWGGHADHCTFNQLVDYIQIMAEQGYRFAITGLLLEMPQRQCFHHPSAPLIDSAMIIIGLSDPRFQGAQGPVAQLWRPFHDGAWGIFAAVLLLFMIVCLGIAVRFHWFRGKSLITAFFIFAGERDQAMAHEATLHHQDAEEAVSFATKYGLAMTLFRIALLALIGIFALFYEVAVVNFLFQQQNQTLSKPIRRLPPRQLQEFVVLNNSALENVFDATVRNGRADDWGGEVPWQHCPTATECIQMVQNREAKFIVTFDVVGKFLLMQHSTCDELSIFETKDVLYQFNGGWLYNFAVGEERRLQVDRELVGLRIKGRTRELVDDALEEYTCADASSRLDIGPMIILIPCLIFVIPPLLCSVLVLVLWKKPERARRGDLGDLEMQLETTTASKRNEEVATDSSSDLTMESMPSRYEGGMWRFGSTR
eukprot:TRINITY_DN62989_c0_g1_i1.p1 TRINITY_DN62989_c0_g1~~TRINITY_DN62989_c0_g1_i1.p1  ORF type:complete len:556 (+),score=71.52 TRINITY_DN62989_c0_g1_i1:423-2090(+)